MSYRPRRSALYMPASNRRAIEKSRSLDCDVVILDLEDAVAPEAKAEAREQAVAAARESGFGRRELVLRSNALDTEWGEDDLRAAAGAGFDAVLLPKLSTVATLAGARGIVGANGPELWAMVETTRGLADLPAIVEAAAAQRLTVLVAGTNDLAKELRCRPGPDRAPLLPHLGRIVLCARMAGLTALDGVINVLDDAQAIEAECRQGLAWGFDGKTLIHPAQVEPANRVFAPDAEEVAWARTVVAAFDEPANAGKAALRVDGKMVELLHRADAERTLAIAEALT